MYNKKQSGVVVYTYINRREIKYMSKTPKRLSLEKEYRKLAKRADQRLLRLENISNPKSKDYNPNFASVKEYAYKRAMRDIRAWSGDVEKPRFNTKPPKNTNQLKAKIADIKRFLESASSTIGATKETKGIIKIYQERANTINEKYGTNFTWQQLAKFFESGLWSKIKSSDNFSSDSDFETISKIKVNFKDVQNAIKNDREVNIDTLDDVENFAINEMINQYGDDIIKALS